MLPPYGRRALLTGIFFLLTIIPVCRAGSFVEAHKRTTAHFKFSWTNTSLPSVSQEGGRETQAQALADALPAVQSAKATGQPSLIFLPSWLGMKGKGGPDLVRELEETKGSKNVLGRSFNGSDNEYRVMIAARWFACIQIDLTKVGPEQHELFNYRNTPIVVIVDHEGKVSDVLVGAHNCKEKDILRAMIKVLEKQGRNNIDSTINKWGKMAVEFRRAEETIITTTSNIKENDKRIAQASATGDSSNAKRAIRIAEKNKKAAEKALEKARERKAEALATERELEKEAEIDED